MCAAQQSEKGEFWPLAFANGQDMCVLICGNSKSKNLTQNRLGNIFYCVMSASTI